MKKRVEKEKESKTIFNQARHGRIRNGDDGYFKGILIINERRQYIYANGLFLQVFSSKKGGGDTKGCHA